MNGWKRGTSSLQEKLNKSKKDNKTLQRDQDKLQDNLREKSNEFKDSEVKLRKLLDADILFLQNTNTENEQLKESLHELEGVKREFDNLEKRHLQTVKKRCQKLKKEKQQLETEIIAQRQNNEVINNKLEMLSVEKLEIKRLSEERSDQTLEQIGKGSIIRAQTMINHDKLFGEK
ncbi:unnamed protein product [Mytilus coruscus]|uniref:Uncharacterized protein n=1 Tax=Mytilus coruscus TaxID=42192 RepID=A0A6J8E606_MYTCO|nr:unnamed protein product [Mytilus coruscus]